MKKRLFIIMILAPALIISVFTGCAGEPEPLRIRNIQGAGMLVCARRIL